MKEDLTLIVLVLDKSGSMEPVAPQTISLINEFIEDQVRQPGEAHLSMTLFDTFIREGTVRPIKEYAPLGSFNNPYTPAGGTALWDAVGITINSIGQYLRMLAERKRPSKVLFVIQTDGEENSSRKFRSAEVKKMIEHQRSKYNWQFMFLGANQDAWLQANAIGIVSEQAVSYTNNSQGIHTLGQTLRSATTSYRNTGTLCIDSNDLRTTDNT